MLSPLVGAESTSVEACIAYSCQCCPTAGTGFPPHPAHWPRKIALCEEGAHPPWISASSTGAPAPPRGYVWDIWVFLPKSEDLKGGIFICLHPSQALCIPHRSLSFWERQMWVLSHCGILGLLLRLFQLRFFVYEKRVLLPANILGSLSKVTCDLISGGRM